MYAAATPPRGPRINSATAASIRWKPTVPGRGSQANRIRTSSPRVSGASIELSGSPRGRQPSHSARRFEHFRSRLTACPALWHHRAPQLPGPEAARARKEATDDAPPELSVDEALTTGRGEPV